MDSATRRTRFRVEGMDCAACAAKIETAVRRIPAVAEVGVSALAGTMTVRHGEGADLEAVTDAVAGLGYKALRLPEAEPAAGGARGPANDHAHGHDAPGLHGHGHGGGDGPWWRGAGARLTLACGLALAASFIVAQLLPQTRPWVFIAAMAVGLVPIARRAIAGALSGSPFSIETLLTVAALGAVVIQAAEEAAVVVFLFLVGELLEGVAAGRARASIRGLARLIPKTAILEEGGTTRTVPAEALAAGAVVIVRPGDRIPADGIVLSGEGAVDEAPVTGESVPKRKTAGEDVYAGTVSQDGVLRIRVTAAAADNTIARIIRLVEEAQEAKAPTERFIDRFSRWYTPAVMAVAALVAVAPPLAAGAEWTTWIYRGLAVLLIGCPCALVISTPAAIAAALAAGARRGLLMKGGAVLETLGKVDRVAFDKTGTLTEGRPKVTDVVAIDREAREVLRLAAALEAGSSHPLAVAILAHARAAGVPVEAARSARALAGRGVAGEVDGAEVLLVSPTAAAERTPLPDALAERIAALNGEGKTVSVLVAQGAVAGLLALRDEPRADAADGIAALKALGAGAVMLTGDNARVAAAVAAGLGIRAEAGLMPEDKRRLVEAMRSEGHVVAKVGDGINDAPALAAADVGIAMGGGTDVALETADAALLNARVRDVAEMIALSRAAMRNIVQNIAISLGLKAVFLVTTVLGVTGLWPAILADTGATVLVTANAMRLIAWRGTRQDRR